MIKNLLSILLLIAFLSACSTGNVEEGGTSVEESLPDMVMRNAKMRLSQEGEEPIEFSVSSLSYYPEENVARLQGLSFTQCDSEGNVRLEGSADKGMIETEGNVLTLSGNVLLHQIGNGMRITTSDELEFKSESEEVSAQGKVEVESRDGRFSGMGFYGNLKSEEYSFRKLESGVFEI